MEKINPDNLNIRNDMKARRLYLNLKGSDDAELKYTLHTETNPHVVEFTSTFVPEAVRKMGIGKKLASEGMSYARKNGYKVQASCPFVSWYLDHHPEFRNLRVRENV